MEKIFQTRLVLNRLLSILIFSRKLIIHYRKVDYYLLVIIHARHSPSARTSSVSLFVYKSLIIVVENFPPKKIVKKKKSYIKFLFK